MIVGVLGEGKTAETGAPARCSAVRDGCRTTTHHWQLRPEIRGLMDLEQPGGLGKHLLSATTFLGPTGDGLPALPTLVIPRPHT